MYRCIFVLAILMTLPFALCSQTHCETWWQLNNMYLCGGDLRDHVQFDGHKSIVQIPGDNKERGLVHCIRLSDFTRDEMVLELGEVSPGIKWELGAQLLEEGNAWKPLLEGTEGGKYRVSLAKLGFPRWAAADAIIRVRAEKPGTMEVIRWAIETSTPNKFAKQHASASKQLQHSSPLERGLVPHWNPEIGAFVCAYNPTHPEHYNYWLEDEGEMLWSFGNYPEMMKLYGKGMRDFIVKYCKAGAPVRRVNNQPLLAKALLTGGKFDVDTGLISVDGDISSNPRINIHHSVYEAHGLLSALNNFFVSYETSDGVKAKIDFVQPKAYRIDYDTPKKDNVQLVIQAEDTSASAEFIVNIFRGRVSVFAKATNKSGQPLRNVTAGFSLPDCQNYYVRDLNSCLLYPNVALLYSEQPGLDHCTLTRLAGPAANQLELKFVVDSNESSPEAANQMLQSTSNSEPIWIKKKKIESVGASAVITDNLASGSEKSIKLADINSGSSSYVEKIEIYRDVDFEEANISLSYVSSYAVLGLATYSYRFPEDKEARQVTNEMMDNLIKARHRIGNRDLAYLLWALDLIGREKDATDIADLIEQRTKNVEAVGSLDGGAMGIGLRRVGRWAAANRITNKIAEEPDNGIAPSTDFLGFGALQSSATAKKAYKQLSYNLRLMYWDQPDRITAHTLTYVEEGPQEMQAYTMVGFDQLLRLYGGITPVRLDPFARGEITKISFNAIDNVWRADLKKVGEIDIYTSFRAPKLIQWNGQQLFKDNWKYNEKTGVIYFTGLNEDGELLITIKGELPKPDPKWKPIDYLGLDRMSR